MDCFAPMKHRPAPTREGGAERKARLSACAGQASDRLGRQTVAANMVWSYNAWFAKAARLLPFAPVALELMAGIFELARFLGIEFGLGSADFTNKDVEVGRTFLVPDESGKREFLYRHRVPPCGKHSKCPAPRPDFYGILMRPSNPPRPPVVRYPTLGRVPRPNFVRAGWAS